jgi:hypothetical protein
VSAAGYSGTPLPQKLGIRPGQRVALLRAPAGFERLLGSDHGALVQRDPRGAGPFDVQVLFCRRRRDLEAGLPRAQQRMTPAGAVWVAWPKRASGVASDLTEDVVREVALPAKLVDVKVCAIDATWSGLKLVIRLRDR